MKNCCDTKAADSGVFEGCCGLSSELVGVPECITRLTSSAAGVALLITGGQPTSMIGCFDVFTLEGRMCMPKEKAWIGCIQL